MVGGMRTNAANAMLRVGETHAAVHTGVGQVATVLAQIDSIREAMKGVVDSIAEILRTSAVITQIEVMTGELGQIVGNFRV